MEVSQGRNDCALQLIESSGHVSGDLLPYICFIEDCKSPDDLYWTSEELTKHILSEHGVTCWMCDECTPDQEQDQLEIFETAQEWRSHLLSAHTQEMTDTQFLRLAELSTHKLVPPINCPLCDDATSEIKPNIDPKIISHIHRFSIRALPWETRGEGNPSEEHLTGKSFAESTNSSQNRRMNAADTEDMPHPLYEQLKVRSVRKLIQQIFSRLPPLKDFRDIQSKFSFEEDIVWEQEGAFREIVLPVVIRLQYSVEELLALKTHHEVFDENQTSESPLANELREYILESLNRLSSLIGDLHQTGGYASVLLKTGDKNTSYIRQWRIRLGQDYIPGDPEYTPIEEDQVVAIALQQAEFDPQTLSGSRPAPWVVPFKRNLLFTGREIELAQLEEKLWIDDRTTKVSIIGLEGVGKTQLALEFVYRTREKHPEYTIIWITAVTLESLQQAYLDGAPQFGILGWESDEVDVKKLVQEYLSKERSGRWLLVFDGVDDGDVRMVQ